MTCKLRNLKPLIKPSLKLIVVIICHKIIKNFFQYLELTGCCTIIGHNRDHLKTTLGVTPFSGKYAQLFIFSSFIGQTLHNFLHPTRKQCWLSVLLSLYINAMEKMIVHENQTENWKRDQQ